MISLADVASVFIRETVNMDPFNKVLWPDSNIDELRAC